MRCVSLLLYFLVSRSCTSWQGQLCITCGSIPFPISLLTNISMCCFQPTISINLNSKRMYIQNSTSFMIISTNVKCALQMRLMHSNQIDLFKPLEMLYYSIPMAIFGFVLQSISLYSKLYFLFYEFCMTLIKYWYLLSRMCSDDKNTPSTSVWHAIWL